MPTSEPVVSVTLDGLPAWGRKVRAVADTVDKDADKRAQLIAKNQARRIISAAPTRQARLAARSVRADGPQVRAGGSRTVKTGVAGGDIFYGSEFGGGARPRTRQFPPWRRSGYYFWPTIKRDGKRNVGEWEKTLDVAAKRWRR